ncbi:hypothetical protein HanIR_Chr15g0743701 [Helianthus annuus]|nr:hypothetical protein HanIR_Chr15g0743701 [Helianthus annuus]
MIKSSSRFCIFHPTRSAISCIFSFCSCVNFVRNRFLFVPVVVIGEMWWWVSAGGGDTPELRARSMWGAEG